jgi:HK97 family phage prohead protease
MSAIAVHHTATTDGAWDGGANTKNLKADGDEAYYRGEFAWQDPDKDATTKAAYKMPHHMVAAADGKIGAANVKACQSIIGILNGGMGGADIPDKDRQGVYNHAAAHLKDAGETPAELKSLEINPAYETRSVKVQLRAGLLDDHPVIEGVATVYNQESVIGGYFREIIKPGSFTQLLATNPDVIAAPNHNWDIVLGRTTNKTLRLSDQADGLHYSIDANPEDPEAMAMYAKIKRGDVNQSSFAFNVQSDQWDQPADKNILPLRTILVFSELIDVSPVTWGAFPQTSVGVRSKLLELSSEQPELLPGGGDAADAVAQSLARARRATYRHYVDLADLF